MWCRALKLGQLLACEASTLSGLIRFFLRILLVLEYFQSLPCLHLLLTDPLCRLPRP